MSSFFETDADYYRFRKKHGSKLFLLLLLVIVLAVSCFIFYSVFNPPLIKEAPIFNK